MKKIQITTQKNQQLLQILQKQKFNFKNFNKFYQLNVALIDKNNNKLLTNLPELKFRSEC